MVNISKEKAVETIQKEIRERKKFMRKLLTNSENNARMQGFYHRIVNSEHFIENEL